MHRRFGRFANFVARRAGSYQAFAGAVLIVLLWALCGPLFQFSNSWQLVINTGTTIVTFLMVFAIQYTTNKDSAALETKIDELILVTKARNRLIGLEDESEEVVRAAQQAIRREVAEDLLEGDDD